MVSGIPEVHLSTFKSMNRCLTVPRASMEGYRGILHEFTVGEEKERGRDI